MSDRVGLNQWVHVENYTVCVRELKDEMVSTRKGPARAVRLLVAYDNQSAAALGFRLGQWLLFDEDGFAYEGEIATVYFGDDVGRRLEQGVLNPGHQAQGWVAFTLPKSAQLSHVQFRSGYLARNVKDIYFDRDWAADVGRAGQVAPPAPKSSWVSKVWSALTDAVAVDGNGSSRPRRLEAGGRYRLVKPLTDFFDNAFVPDTIFTFEKRYPPYHGLHIWVFAETAVYLHAADHADLLADPGKYFEPAG